VEIRSRYEATINEAASAERYRQALRAELGAGFDDEDLLLPIMASEDFSYYLNEIPGAFALVGMSVNSDQDTAFTAPCHSPDYQFNDAIIETVMRVFCRLVNLPVPAPEQKPTPHRSGVAQ